MKYRRTPRFKRSFKQLKKKHYPVELILSCLQAIADHDEVALAKIDDHALHGDWNGYREFHPGRYSNTAQNDNWIVIYSLIENELVLVLVDTGPHKILKSKPGDY